MNDHETQNGVSPHSDTISDITSRQKENCDGVDTNVVRRRIMTKYQHFNILKEDEKTPLSFSKKEFRTTLEKTLIFLVVLCFVAIIILAIVLGVQTSKDDTSDSPTAGASTAAQICNTKGCTLAAARLQSSLNEEVKPCDNFYEFACGTWMKKNVIPEDRSSMDMFGVIRDEVEVIEKYREIHQYTRSEISLSRTPCAHLEPLDVTADVLETTHQSSDGEAVKKSKDLYASCMNTSLIESLNISVAISLLNELGGWPVLGGAHGGNWNASSYSLTGLLVKLISYSNSPLISFYAYTDSKNSSARILYVDQSDYGLPGRKYYLKGRDDPMVKAYEEFAISVARAFGADEATATRDMTAAVDLEMKIANISMPDEDRRDNFALYNKMTIADLSANFTPPAEVKFNWMQYINDTLSVDGIDITVDSTEPIVVRAIPYFEKLFGVLAEADDRDIANYLVWRIMKNRVSNLPERFKDMINNYNKVVYGIAIPRARWRTCASYVNSNMGLALGRLFVKEAFDEAAKSETLEMIQNLREAFGELLVENDWMDDATRELAKEKAAFIQEKIGYEDYILDNKELDRLYENYTVKADAYFDNVLHMLNRGNIDSFRRLRMTVDKDEWTSAPATVNAYYNSVLNRIMFPAGILQQPFFDKTQPKSMNYGGIGVVIGHEITHGFDDRGRQYDKDGNLRQWWTDEVIQKFKQEVQCIVNQYGDFSVPEADGMNLNGIQTQGENIADNGGLKESYRAYRKWIAKQGKEELQLPGVSYNHDQLFFINFAQVWCSNMRKENAINRILSGVHSPGRYRVIGTLQNSHDFAKAFSCQSGSYMNPERKCSVW